MGPPRNVAICQPHYLPWLGYFAMIDAVDTFVFLDDVDFIKREWKNRNRIRGDREAEDTRWLTVPVDRSCQRHTPLAACTLSTAVDWRRDHLNALRQVYRKAPFFTPTMVLMEELLAPVDATLADLNIRTVSRLCEHLGITTPLVRSSAFGVPGSRTTRLRNLCLALGASHYLANNGSAAYLDREDLVAHGLTVSFQDYAHPTYPQVSGRAALPWLSHLSIVDALMNLGPATAACLREGTPRDAAAA